MKLALDAEATVVGYWSDGTADVEIAASLRNEGDLRLDRDVGLTIACSQDGEVIKDCGEETVVSLPDGYGPVTETLTMRFPPGEVSLEIDYGGEQAGSLLVNVPKQIVGVDREVWDCFSDTSNVTTTIARWEKGVGCAAWLWETVQKWDRQSPVKVWLNGPDSFTAEFKDALVELSPMVNLQFEWVEVQSSADISAYVGISILEAELLGVYCSSPEAFGCADNDVDLPSGQVRGSQIIVYNLWPDQGNELGEFDHWHRTRFRSAMIHEAIHALAGMLHRTEMFSIMTAEVHHSADLTPMDEALLRLHGHELVKSGMNLDEIERQIVFSNELIDPQNMDSPLKSWRLVSNAYRELQETPTARFSLRSSYPDCSEEFGWADYDVGSLTHRSPYFGWVRIDDGEDHFYALHPYADESEYWHRSRSGWEPVSHQGFSDSVPGWRWDLSDPHHMLESILYYAEWANAEVSTDMGGMTTLRFELDMTRVIQHSPAESVEIVLIIDDQTYQLLEYRMEWRLGEDENCDAYRVEARDGRYDIAFTFPDAVRWGSDFFQSCDAKQLGVVSGYVRYSGYWAAECGPDRRMEGYAQPFRFSLNGWAFVRFELLSADDIAIDLVKVDGSGDTTVVDPSASGYLVRGLGVPDDGRLLWAHVPLAPGDYTVEAITKNRGLPGTFTLIVAAQVTPPPPYRFKSIIADGHRTCGLLSDGTPLCWGGRSVEGGGWVAPSGPFASISIGGHVCALREDGAPVCWDFKGEGEHTCFPTDDGIYCTPDDQNQSSLESRGQDGGDQGNFVGVTAGYYGQTPPADERLTSISTGWVHSCGLRRNGTPVCWGSNQDGKASPPTGETFLSIDAGTNHSCGLREDGTALCWGADWDELLSVPSGERFVALNAGEEHSCGLREDGSIVCWGDGGRSVCTPKPGGSFSCLGIGVRDFIPQLPPEREQFASLGSGDPHCALRAGGSAVCWTEYQSGLLPTPEGEQFKSISSSSQHACALRSDGTAACWGWNRYGQASPPSGVNLTYNQIMQSPVGLVSISAGRAHTCALDADGVATCWGPDSWTGNVFDDRLTTISTGLWHACGVRPDGTVVCRGSNEDRQSSPRKDRFVSVACGSWHTCGIRSDGTVRCWGNNDFGQSSPPLEEVFSSISAGEFHTCGLLSDGTVRCWGRDDFGQSSPPHGELFSSISVGEVHACGLRLDGTPVCWGRSSGQSWPPHGESFTSISSGEKHTCALRADGSAVCWGLDHHGQSSPPNGRDIRVDQQRRRSYLWPSHRRIRRMLGGE